MPTSVVLPADWAVGDTADKAVGQGCLRYKESSPQKLSTFVGCFRPEQLVREWAKIANSSSEPMVLEAANAMAKKTFELSGMAEGLGNGSSGEASESFLPF